MPFLNRKTVSINELNNIKDHTLLNLEKMNNMNYNYDNKIYNDYNE
jgi:hypothetical protein